MLRPILLALSYVFLSFVSFPGVDAGWVAWFSWVPFLYLLNRFEKPLSFLVAVVSIEWVKWILLVVWLRHVSWFIVIGVALAFSLYHAIWFFTLRLLTGKKLWEGLTRLSPLSVLGYALLWASLEMIRTQAYGLTGAHFSITQWKYPLMLQSVSWFGGYGLSALLIAVNLWFAQAILFATGEGGVLRRKVWLPVGCISLVFAIAMLAGYERLSVKTQDSLSDKGVRIGVIQPYCPAYTEWNYDRMSDAIITVINESGDLAKRENIDMMVWPEGTLPGSIYTGSSMEREVIDVVDHSIRVPLVFGNQSQIGQRIYNSVLLCVPNKGVSEQVYSKRILVPFGEFIPFRKWLGPLKTLVPIPEDFSRGEKMQFIAVPIGDRNINICSQICYEDCFPQLLLGEDLSGVDLIFVATYNVWYGEEFGAYFHAAHSVLRAAEVGKPVLRCGSAGWSGLIDGYGRILEVVRDEESGSIYFRGSSVVEWTPGNPGITFYKENHLWLHALYASCALGLIIYVVRKSKKLEPSAEQGY